MAAANRRIGSQPEKINSLIHKRLLEIGHVSSVAYKRGVKFSEGLGIYCVGWDSESKGTCNDYSVFMQMRHG